MSESENPVVLRVNDLMVGYGGSAILKEVNFNLRKSSCLVIMGESGCGKSTLLKTMIGLLRPQLGSVNILGKDLWGDSFEPDRNLLLQIGVLFQGSALWSSMTLEENVSLPLQIFTNLSSSEIRDLVQYKLSLVGLSDFEKFYPSELSGGMRKRAGLARAMALDPQILFFDEPSAGLDPTSSRKLDELIIELKESLDLTFVVISHELPSIFSIADDSIYLGGSEFSIIDRGCPRWLLDNSTHAEVRSFLSRTNHHEL